VVVEGELDTIAFDEEGEDEDDVEDEAEDEELCVVLEEVELSVVVLLEVSVAVEEVDVVPALEDVLWPGERTPLRILPRLPSTVEFV